LPSKLEKMIPQTPDTPISGDESTPLILTADALKKHTIYCYLVAFLSAIGGFLFGYDTGIISGAMIFVRDVFKLNDWWQEAIVSSTLLAAWLFSILAGSATSRLGRKPVIVFSSFTFVLGSVLMSVAWNKLILLAGRLVVGAGVGLASMTVPMYIAEVAPSAIRGQLVMMNMCCITGGQFIASLIAYWFSLLHGDQSWRYMLGFAALPAAIQFFAFLFMPESPRWLVAKRKYDQAKRVLKKMRPKGADIEAEFNAIRENDLNHARREALESLSLSTGSLQGRPTSTLRRILARRPVRRALVVGCLLQMVQQLSGINTVMYYSASIFEMSGVRSKQKALILSAATSSVNFIFTILGYYLVERAGRRSLTLYSLFGVVLSLAILGAGFQFAYVNSPKVNMVNHTMENHPCDTMADCSACSRLPECGFCFSAAPNSLASNSVFEASCLRVNSTTHDRSQLGQCIAGSTDNLTWAYEWCPSAYSWITVLGMILYLMFFAPGMGPMPWTINSEIYPQWARSWCLSVTTSVNWLFNLLMSMTFLSLTRAITKFGAFYLYAILAAAGFVYFYFVLPETKGKTLEELEDLF